MKTIDSILDELNHRMGEHIEMQKDKKGYVINLLAKLVIYEREKNEYYRKVLKEVNR